MSIRNILAFGFGILEWQLWKIAGNRKAIRVIVAGKKKILEETD